MIKQKWDQIIKNQEVRQTLSSIRKDIKDSSQRNELMRLVKGEEEILIALLDAEDAKTRKNAALLMGDIGEQKFLAPIYTAYETEKQRFVKSSYLAAIGKFDYSAYAESLKERLSSLQQIEMTTENQKHIMEELHELSNLIVHSEGTHKHTFTGWNESYEIVLITNRKYADLVKEQLMELAPESKTRVFGAGIQACVKNLNWIKELRTYQEILFVVKGMKTCSLEPVGVAAMISRSGLLDFLSKGHGGARPYYFRVELKSKRNLNEKSKFVKRLSGQLVKQSDGVLINTTDNYEFELRVIENKEGNCNVLVKLFTIKDMRFSYRKEVIPASIKPVNAALCTALAKDYMKEDAQVLDPFCGVGSMLIERHKAVRANTTYGIDIQEEAIVKARKNTEAAGQIIHYINRDFFRFQHEYLFDEVITDMPFPIGRVTEDEVLELYQRFFMMVPRHLKEDAVLILYSHNGDFVKQLAPGHGFRIVNEFEVSRREGIYVFILKEERQGVLKS